MGFFDFAGSTIVHGTGGWVALVGTIILGPRIGKYGLDGKTKVLAGHSLPLAALGVFILWFGWFGFNPGSQLAASGTDNARAIALITINTNLAAAAGALAAMASIWAMFGKPDLTMCMNGALAGLVAITAPCAVVSPSAAIVIGLIAGFIVVMGVRLLDALKIDDPVGCIPVHGFNGMWGTIAVGIWGQKALGLANDGLFHGGGFSQLGVQIMGTVVCAVFAMVAMSVVFLIVKGHHRPASEQRGRSQGSGHRGNTAWKVTPISRFSPPGRKRDGHMRLIIAYVKPERLNDVKQALYEAKVYNMSVTNIVGSGRQRGFSETYRGVEQEVNLLKKVRLEIGVK